MRSKIGQLDAPALAERLAEHGLHPAEGTLGELHALLPTCAALVERVHRGFAFCDEPAHAPHLPTVGLVDAGLDPEHP